MSNRPKRESMSLEEATVSDMWETPPLWKCSNGRACARSKTSTTSAQSSSQESPGQHSCNRLP
jgi:hypothetical protein